MLCRDHPQGVVTSLAPFAFGPVGLIHTPRLGIEYKKPTLGRRHVCFRDAGSTGRPISDMGALVGLVLLFTVRSGKAPTVLTLTATLKS
jgi:hypothetical protein